MLYSYRCCHSLSLSLSLSLRFNIIRIQTVLPRILYNSYAYSVVENATVAKMHSAPPCPLNGAAGEAVRTAFREGKVEVTEAEADNFFQCPVVYVSTIIIFASILVIVVIIVIVNVNFTIHNVNSSLCRTLYGV